MRDHDLDPDNNYQQSDVVTILTNLGSIPDYTARRFHLNDNYAVDFMSFMSEYKAQFEERNGVKWEYSNDKLLEKYLNFKEMRKSIGQETKQQKEMYDGGTIEMKAMKRGRKFSLL